LWGGVELIAGGDISHSKDLSKASAILSIITGYKRFSLPAIFNQAVALEDAK
jgi:hypothetical protein